MPLRCNSHLLNRGFVCSKYEQNRDPTNIGERMGTDSATEHATKENAVLPGRLFEHYENFVKILGRDAFEIRFEVHLGE